MTDHDDPDDRAARQSANLARHLSGGQHPSTVLLLARHAPGGRPDATAAELTGADDDRLALAVDGPAGQAQSVCRCRTGPTSAAGSPRCSRRLAPGCPTTGLSRSRRWRSRWGAADAARTAWATASASTGDTRGGDLP